MISRSQIQIAITLAVVAWALLLFVEGVSLKPTYLKPYSIAIGIVTLCFLAYDRWIWKFPPLSRTLGKPVLRGTWKGEIRSEWIDPSTGTRIAPIEVYVAIFQTSSTISLRLMSKESSSSTLTAALQVSKVALPRIASMYQNIPSLSLRRHSGIHHGAILLDVYGLPVQRLFGWYWTDRDTKGEISLEVRSRKIYSSFNEAQRSMANPT
ncbi:putative membrane protein [Candidatus Protofrankia californiensis]|uniref:Putative membrane protein n=1 Tax=Candidatus Protofrankia californiensis TaxID=1839754 RepID=A0A1C3NSW1_9ACTN|nr:putative membrane protein [Candidatus Protofrankia californiensis]